jgi:hypothetical protein
MQQNQAFSSMPNSPGENRALTRIFSPTVTQKLMEKKRGLWGHPAPFLRGAGFPSSAHRARIKGLQSGDV